MGKPTSIFIATVLLLSGWLPVSAESAPDRTVAAWEDVSLPEGSAAALRLFGCIVPLPPNYLLNTDTKVPGKIEFNRLNLPLGIISIGEYEAPDKEFVDVVYEKQIGTLTVVQIMLKKTTFRTKPTLTIIHDNQRKLSIGGHDEHWAEPMARYCSEHMLDN